MPKRPTMSDRKAETPRVATRLDTALMGQERVRHEVVELLLDEVMPNRQQPRQSFDRTNLADLADSIRLHGVLEPVIVRAIPLTLYEGSGRQYELIAGERRWRASALAARRTIPALVFPETTSDQAALELAIIENVQRENLHPLDEAVAFGRMQTDLHYTYTQIAERLGKSKGYVQNRLRLLQLEADLRQLVAERPDTLSHVYELAKISDSVMRQPLIDAVRNEALSFVETRERVQAIVGQAPALPATPLAEERPAPPEQPEHLGDAESYVYPYDQRPARNLSARERAMFQSSAAKIALLLNDSSGLNAADWALLEQLARKLSALLDERNEAP